MSTKEVQKGPDDVIHELGGCGRFQVRMAVLVHFMKTIVCWSLTSMIFVSAVPKWRCLDEEITGVGGNASYSGNITFGKSCNTVNGTKCSSYEFSTEMRTIVSEVRNILRYRNGQNDKHVRIPLIVSEILE